jgi:hypothetical protein
LATTDLPGLPSIVSYVRRDYYDSLRLASVNEVELLAWYADQKLLQNPSLVYSDALNLVGDTPRSRQQYLRKFFDGKNPGESHLMIGRLVHSGFLDAVFTTNFDTLMEEGIYKVIGSAVKVAAHAETVSDILVTETCPKVIKLHGDYLFSDIRNTEEETKTITRSMHQKLRTFLSERGLIVLGYSGNDNSVMSLFEEMAYEGRFFPYGLYWLHLETSPPNGRVISFVEQSKGKLLPIQGATTFLIELASRCTGP